MRVQSGWAEFVDPRAGSAVARGRLYVIDPPLPCPVNGHWEGEVTLLRGGESLATADAQGDIGRGRAWLLRFEHGAQLRWVRIASLIPAWAPSGLHATARVVSQDDRFPSRVSELGGDG